MTEHNLVYCPCASFTNAQLSLLKAAALDFDKLVILHPVGASWPTIGADYGILSWATSSPRSCKQLG